MATLAENAAAVKAAQVAIDAAIVAKGGTTTGGLTNAAAAIATIPGGGGGGGYNLTVVEAQAFYTHLVLGVKFSDGSEAFLGGVRLDFYDHFIQPGSVIPGVKSVFTDMEDIYESDNYFKLNGVDSPRRSWIDLSGDTLLSMYANDQCVVSGALISLADGSVKSIDDITYGDILRVWNFDDGKWDVAKPIWVKRREIATSFWTDTFSDGRVLKTVGPRGHRLLDLDKGRWEYDTDCVGRRVKTVDGDATLLSCERTIGDVAFFNVITERHFNVMCNGVFTSSSRNNLYPIRDMRFVKEPRIVRPMSDFSFPTEASKRFYEGCRLFETADDADYVNSFIVQKVAHDSITEVR